MTAPDRFFPRQNGALHAEGVSLADIAAQFGTPTFVYSRAALENAYRNYLDVLSGRNAQVCYAVKANSNLAILATFAALGAGFDIVSGGELARVIAAGGDAGKVVFSGVGKSETEMRQALAAGIGCFNVESPSELERLNRVAGEAGKIAPIAFRVNPNVDPKTHPYISTGLKSSKFGVAFIDALPLYRRAATLPNVKIVGVACHIGSQLLDPAPIAEAADKVLGLVDTLAAEGIILQHLDLGGGLGICYQDEVPPSHADYLGPLLQKLSERPLKLFFEPGRSLVGNAGMLLTKVETLKHGEEKNFAVVDAAMNDLARPALYDAYHHMAAVQVTDAPAVVYEVVGPICESGDFLGQDLELAVREGDLLAIFSAGAYGMTMSSNYNTRPRAAEVMADGSQMRLIRRRETLEQLLAAEQGL